MLTEKEATLLRLLSKEMLIRKDELRKKLKGSMEGYEFVLSKLISDGYVKSIESIGSHCFAITQKGTKALF